MSAPEHNLFAHLPPGIFKPLARARHRLYWQVLLRLYEEHFDDDLEIREYGHSRSIVVETIQATLDQYPLLWIAEQESDDPPELETDASGRPGYIYRELCKTGWLEEERHGYHDFVIMTPRVLQLMAALLEVADGRALVMAGKLKGLKASINEVYADPENSADTLTEMAKEAGRFARHLNSIRGALKGLYEAIKMDTPAREVVSTFFNDFLKDLLRRDYTSIKTTDNPLIIRDEILRVIGALRYEADTHRALLAGYNRVFADLDSKERVILMDRDLFKLEQVFNNIERQLDSIDAMKLRYEQRVDTVIEYTMRSPANLGKRIQSLIGALAQAIDAGDELRIPGPLVVPEPVGTARYAKPRIQRPPPKPRPTKSRTVSQEALERSRRERAAKAATQIDDDKLANYLSRQFGIALTLSTEDLRIENVEDYFCALMLHRSSKTASKGKAEFPEAMKGVDVSATNNWVETDYLHVPQIILTRTKR